MYKGKIGFFILVFLAICSFPLFAEMIGVKVSPDGKTIGFLARKLITSGEGPNYALQFWTADIKRQHKRQRTFLSANCLNGPAGVIDFEFSPQGRKVALLFWPIGHMRENYACWLLVLDLAVDQVFLVDRGSADGMYQNPCWISEGVVAVDLVDVNANSHGRKTFPVKKIPLLKY